MNRKQRRQSEGFKQQPFEPELFIKESNAIEGIHEEEEIKQSLIAWDFLIKQDAITHGVICKVQKIITINQAILRPDQRGYYRSFSKTNVLVNGHTAPKPEFVNNMMAAWLQDLPRMTPLISHIRFEYIHPFADGNGRTGRMFYWYCCIKKKTKPYLHTAKKREMYYRFFDERRIEQLEKNNWGIDHQNKMGFEAIVKLQDGRTIKAGFFDKPTEKEIKESLPETMQFKQLISIREL